MPGLDIPLHQWHAAGEPSRLSWAKEKERKKRKYTAFVSYLLFLPIPSAPCPGDLSLPHRDTEDAARTAAPGLFHSGDALRVQTSGCRQVWGCQDGDEDHEGPVPILCSADKPLCPGKPFPLTFPELRSNQEQTPTCCSPSADPEMPHPTQTAARSEQALVMPLFPAQCKALRGFICACTTPRQAAAASSPLLSAASLHCPPQHPCVPPALPPSAPELGMVRFPRGSRRRREMLAPNGLISSESTRGSRRGRTKDGHGGVEGGALGAGYPADAKGQWWETG